MFSSDTFRHTNKMSRVLLKIFQYPKGRWSHNYFLHYNYIKVMIVMVPPNCITTSAWSSYVEKDMMPGSLCLMSNQRNSLQFSASRHSLQCSYLWGPANQDKFACEQIVATNFYP
jgi:hypothetical protein